MKNSIQVANTRKAGPRFQSPDFAEGAEESHSVSASRGSRGRAGRATGPRTAAGKRRSRANALKTGIFSKMLFLPHESPAEYQALLQGWKDYFEPQGMPEELLVEELATIVWRKHRLIFAENTEIVRGVKLRAEDSISDKAMEAWDAARAGELGGGILRHRKNVFVTRNAIELLEVFREAFALVGFQKDKDPFILRKLYGLDHDNGAPWGVFKSFLALSKIAAEEQESNDCPKPGDWKERMLKILDAEIKRLRELASKQVENEKEKLAIELTVAPLRDEAMIERTTRYEAHLSREFNRTLANLERLQRIRLGQPLAPAIKIDLMS